LVLVTAPTGFRWSQMEWRATVKSQGCWSKYLLNSDLDGLGCLSNLNRQCVLSGLRKL
jgi:hypothetical protein